MTKRTSFNAISRSAAVLAALVLPAQLGAQNGRPDTTLKLETSYAGVTDLEARGAVIGEVAVSRVVADLNVPLPPLAASTMLAADFGYSGFFLDRSGIVPLPGKLESLEAGVAARHRVDEHWSVLARASVGLAGAEGTFSSDGFGVGFFGLATYQFSERFSAGFGFVYGSLSESLPVMPVVGVRWDFMPDWRFTLAFPSTRVSWTASKRLTLHGSLDFDNGSFYVKDDPRPATIGAGRPSVADTVLDYTSISAGFGATYLLSDVLTLDATLGYNFLRTADFDERGYEIEADGGAPITRLSLTYAF